jgi:UDP-glucuronate 4-epimerase
MKRDFTYIDDIIEGIIRVINKVPQPNSNWSGEYPDPATSNAPYKIYNIGNNQPIELMKIIEIIEICLEKKANKNMLPIQLGDALQTHANIDSLFHDVGFMPNTSIELGIKKFILWYKSYYHLKG